MDTKQLDDALARLFRDEGARIVFWHDPAQEFLDFITRLPFLTFGDITVHIIRLDQVSALGACPRMTLHASWGYVESCGSWVKPGAVSTW